MTRSRRLGAPVATVLLSMAMGCGDKLVPVEGTITLNGEPVAGATVLFFAQEGDSGRIQPAGATDSQGHFALHTKTSVGALPGKYRVSVSRILIVAVASRNRPKPQQDSGPAEPPETSIPGPITP